MFGNDDVYGLILQQRDLKVKIKKYFFEIPNKEAKNSEAAHIHVRRNGDDKFRGKIWIGIDERYSISDENRYLLKQAEPNKNVTQIPIGDFEDIICPALKEALAQNRRGLRDLYIKEWEGGWYRNF